MALPCLLLGAASCNKDSENTPKSRDYLKVKADISSSGVGTKAGITSGSFSGSESLGVFIFRDLLGVSYTPGSNTSEHLVTENVEYTATGGVEFASLEPIRLGSAKGTVYAYYPYDEYTGVVGDGSDIPVYVSENQGTGLNDGRRDDPVQYDYMYATPVENRSNATEETATANLTMHHVLSMVSFKFLNKDTTYPGVGVVNKITLQNKPYKQALKSGSGTMNISNGEVIFNAVSFGGISLYPSKPLLDEEGEVHYPKMLIPATVFLDDDAELIFTIDDAEYTVDLPAMEMEQGVRYEFPVSISGTELVLGTVSIEEWVTVAMDETEIKEPDKD